MIARSLSLGAVLAAGLAGGTLAADLRPLGDGSVSSGPRAGFVFACQQSFPANGPGASREGPWIKGAEWDLDEKVKVAGAVDWPNALLTIEVQGERRLVTGNNLPSHPTGVFPIARDDPAFYYDRNPNPIRAIDLKLDLPRLPEVAAAPSCVPMGIIGIALTGAVVYNALDLRGKDAAAHEMLDACLGHPQGAGQYHYHAPSPCLLDTSGPAGKHSDLVGYALDGFGIYGPYGEAGAKLASKDLDACHGHTHEVAWDGKKTALYHYHFTPDYPYSVGCFAGAPIAVARRPGGGPLARP